MAFSLRKMFSINNYFKKSDNKNSDQSSDLNVLKRRHTYVARDKRFNIQFERTEADSTSKHSISAPNEPTIPEKLSLSESDITKRSPKNKHGNKKLKLDINKANKSMNEVNLINTSENTPKHVLLEREHSQKFRERLSNIDFDKSFDAFDVMLDHSSSDIDSLSDTDISLVSDCEKTSIKMCRKVESTGRSTGDYQIIPSTTPDSFAVLDGEKNEEERINLLMSYQEKLDNLEFVLRTLLTEFKFHIEYSKVFCARSLVSLPKMDETRISQMITDLKNFEIVSRGVSPAGSINVVLEKEDKQVKRKLKKQLLMMKKNIESFISVFSQGDNKKTQKLFRSSTIEKKKVRNTKKSRHYDFPDLHYDFNKLFSTEVNDEADRCVCHCHEVDGDDSGLNAKGNDRSLSSQSITSSIGNFSLDSITLSAYSESLDLIVSYNSYQDSSLYSSLLQKPATDRITFYIQVHSIEVKCESNDNDFESKTIITFDCPACKSVLKEENSLIRHILSSAHCEKIHFLYKTAYIKKCVAKGKEIQPSTVLNPMTMYRDDNKIVCFGDAMYACSLCFECLIIGESVLMAHCVDQDHLRRKEMMFEDMIE